MIEIPKEIHRFSKKTLKFKKIRYSILNLIQILIAERRKTLNDKNVKSQGKLNLLANLKKEAQ